MGLDFALQTRQDLIRSTPSSLLTFTLFGQPDGRSSFLIPPSFARTIEKRAVALFSVLAEREGFEPSIRSLVYRISSAAHSTTLASLRNHSNIVRGLEKYRHVVDNLYRRYRDTLFLWMKILKKEIIVQPV